MLLLLVSFEHEQGPRDFAWGAADAAGSVVSSASDMSIVLRMLMGIQTGANDQLISPKILGEIMTGQMVVPNSWMKECGIATDGYVQITTIRLPMQSQSYSHPIAILVWMNSNPCMHACMLTACGPLVLTGTASWVAAKQQAWVLISPLKFPLTCRLRPRHSHTQVSWTLLALHRTSW